MLIRHITFSSYFLNIKKDGYLKPDPEWQSSAYGNYIPFERNWKGDAFFKVFYLSSVSMPGSFSPNDLMALIFDEQDLLIKGYQVNDGTEENRSYIKSMLKREEISEKEYREIGKLVNISGEISLDYVKNIDIPDNERLEKIGLL